MLDTDATASAGGALRRLGAWLSGDRYMVGAYSPRPEAATAATPDQRAGHDRSADVHDR